MRSHARVSVPVSVLVAALVLGVVPPAAAHVELEATLDATQETPAPTVGDPSPTGTATFVFDPETGALQYTITTQNLSGAVTAAHLHTGLPGVAGSVAVTLDTSLTGTVTNLTPQQVNDLFDGRLYANVHTALNPIGGEIRGQVEIAGESTCRCGDGTHKAFLRCVKDAIKALDRSDRRLVSVKAIKRAAKLSSCGRKRTARKAIACCLPQTPAEGVVIGRVCAPIRENACTRKKGASLGSGSSCLPANPCTPVASPSGAFLDAPDGDLL